MASNAREAFRIALDKTRPAFERPKDDSSAREPPGQPPAFRVEPWAQPVREGACTPTAHAAANVAETEALFERHVESLRVGRRGATATEARMVLRTARGEALDVIVREDDERIVITLDGQRSAREAFGTRLDRELERAGLGDAVSVEQE